jgi:uncharacterized protein (TIGR00297 family)
MRDARPGLEWQSKAILLIVVPWTATSMLLQAQWWLTHEVTVAWQALGISFLFGLAVWRLRAATMGGALTGAAITANLIFATARYPYEWTWLHGGLMPLLAVFLLTYTATKIGRAKKEQLGTGESKRGRNAAQVAANLGMAAIAASVPTLFTSVSGQIRYLGPFLMMAALAEAAADTVSSEIGQVFGGTPYMLTTMKPAAAGTDGAVSLTGTLAGAGAAAIIAFVGMLPSFVSHAYRKFWETTWILTVLIVIAGIIGLIFDSLLGATLERRGKLNNDAVNFLSTLFATATMWIGASISPYLFFRQ